MMRLLIPLVAAGLVAGCQSMSALNYGPAASPRLAAAGWRETSSAPTITLPRGTFRVEKALACTRPSCGGVGGAAIVSFSAPPAPGRIGFGRYAEAARLSNGQVEAMLRLSLTTNANASSFAISNVRRTGAVISFDLSGWSRLNREIFTTGRATIVGETMRMTAGSGMTPQISRERLRLISDLR